MKVEMAKAKYTMHCNNPSFHGDSSMSHETCCVIIPEDWKEGYHTSTIVCYLIL